MSKEARAATFDVHPTDDGRIVVREKSVMGWSVLCDIAPGQTDAMMATAERIVAALSAPLSADDAGLCERLLDSADASDGPHVGVVVMTGSNGEWLIGKDELMLWPKGPFDIGEWDEDGLRDDERLLAAIERLAKPGEEILSMDVPLRTVPAETDGPYICNAAYDYLDFPCAARSELPTLLRQAAARIEALSRTASEEA